MGSIVPLLALGAGLLALSYQKASKAVSNVAIKATIEGIDYVKVSGVGLKMRIRIINLSPNDYRFGSGVMVLTYPPSKVYNINNLLATSQIADTVYLPKQQEVTIVVPFAIELDQLRAVLKDYKNGKKEFLIGLLANFDFAGKLGTLSLNTDIDVSDYVKQLYEAINKATLGGIGLVL